jgi:hypothetical protein
MALPFFILRVKISAIHVELRIILKMSRCTVDMLASGSNNLNWLNFTQHGRCWPPALISVFDLGA